MSSVIIRGKRDVAHFERRLGRKKRRSAMKAQWRARQADTLAVAREQLHALVGSPESYPTHAAYMDAVRAAVAAKREAEAAQLGGAA